jgi:hypothetical protein
MRERDALPVQPACAQALRLHQEGPATTHSGDEAPFSTHSRDLLANSSCCHRAETVTAPVTLGTVPMKVG